MGKLQYCILSSTCTKEAKPITKYDDIESADVMMLFDTEEEADLYASSNIDCVQWGYMIIEWRG